MCLITTQTEPYIAKEDITVYKELRRLPEGLCAPYNHFIYELGKSYQTEIKTSTDRACFDNYDSKRVNEYDPNWKENEEVLSYGSGFHSCLTFERMKLSREHSSRTLWNVIVECTIPKDSEYYVGFSELAVSNKIIVNKILTYGKIRIEAIQE